MKIHPRSIRILKFVLLVSMVILLWQYVKAIDINELQAALTNAGSTFGWVILTTSIAYTLATLGWWYCLSGARSQIPMASFFMIRHIGETFGIFTPASVAGGDTLKVVLLKPYAVNASTVVASVVLSRLFMIASQLCLLATALLWLFLNGKLLMPTLPDHSFLIFAVVCGLFFIIGYGLVKFRRGKWIQLAGKNAQWLRLNAKLKGIREEIRRFYQEHPGEFALAFILFTLHWIAGSLEFYIVLKIFGYPVSVVDALLIDMGVIAIKSAGAFIPGQLGVEELGNKLMLSMIGIASVPLWISVSALRRTRQLFWILVGVVFYSIIVHRKRSFL